MNDTFTDLYNEFLGYVNKDDEAGARKFLIDNLQKFPEEVQEKLTFAFFEEALMSEAKGVKEIADMQKQGLERRPLVRIMADCLKQNHYHFAIEEIQENGISRFMQKLGTGYTKYFNKKYERVGPLFQGVFKTVEVKSDEQLVYLIAYINAINPGQELEPELKSAAQNPEEILSFIEEHFPWSTHLEYLDRRDSIIIDKGIVGTLFTTPKHYRKFIEDIIRGKKKINGEQQLFLE